MGDGLLIIGGGGHGRVVADAALETGRWPRIAFVDDRAGQLRDVDGVPVIGRLGDLGDLRGHWSEAVVAIGDAGRRLAVQEVLKDLGYSLPVVVHPSAVVSRRATLGAGTVVLAQAAINAGATIGAACIVNTGATVDHDCQLGLGVHICPGVNLAGSVRIGARSWIGIGCAVRDGLSIGSDVMVGAGSVVVRSVPDGVTAFGVPARICHDPGGGANSA